MGVAAALAWKQTVPLLVAIVPLSVIAMVTPTVAALFAQLLPHDTNAAAMFEVFQRILAALMVLLYGITFLAFAVPFTLSWAYLASPDYRATCGRTNLDVDA